MTQTLGGGALFGQPAGGPGGRKGPGFADIAMGTRHPTLNRYKLPLMPGESGVKSLPPGAEPWVPGGVQSATNLAGSISETRGLGIWERERSQLGLAMDARLYDRLAMLVRSALADGLDLGEKLKDSELGKRVRAELELIHKEAKDICGANEASRKGTAFHDGWEQRAPGGTALFGQRVREPGEGRMFVALESLLERAGLERVPGLQERVVRNVALRAAGRFDDVLRTTREIVWEVEERGRHVIPVGTMLMADLKTKKDPFWSWLEVRIQLAVYASAELMLKGSGYIPGPKFHVSQQWGVVLHMPQDGKPPVLKRVNLVAGLRAAQLARQVCDERSEGKSVATHGEAEWPSEQPVEQPQIGG